MSSDAGTLVTLQSPHASTTRTTRSDDRGGVRAEHADVAQSQPETKGDTFEHTAKELINLFTQTLINMNKQLHTQQAGHSYSFLINRKVLLLTVKQTNLH